MPHAHPAQEHAHHDHAATASHDLKGMEHGPYALVLGGHEHHHGPGSSYGATIGLVLASYDSRLFAGDYQGAIVGGRFSSGRFGVMASVAGYRLTKNGRTIEGLGDVILHGHASLLARGPWSAGVMLMTSLPTGDAREGFGMGHVMWMPELWAGRTYRRAAFGGAVGYAHAMGGSAVHAEHGGGAMWPLVSPMNASELTYGGIAMYALARALGAGLHVQGAVPIGDGDRRLIGGFRVLWVAGRTETTVEIQQSVVGDPFKLRGVVETSVRFR